MDGFASLGFPHCAGSCDGTHLEMVSPVRQGDDFINRKSFYSILLQGTTDHTGRFTHIEVGWSGKNHDAYVLRNSTLFEAMSAGKFLPSNDIWKLGDTEVPPLLFADRAYPIRKWLMKPYGGNLNREQKHFNYCLSRARNVVERAFGRLKSRWQRLNGRLQVSEENVPSVITACVMLHNICEAKGHAAIRANAECQNGVTLSTLGLPMANDENQRKRQGRKVRDAICSYSWEHRETSRR